MCRFTLYLGPPIRLRSFLFESEHSLVAQSTKSREREEPLNGDGFGVGWYSPEHSDEPGVFRSITPAWNNRNLQSLSRVVASHCVLAHVRAATHASGVNEANCHPFRYGDLLFMHNGDVAKFPKLRRALLETVCDAAFENVFGSTDSEHVFALVIDELERGTLGDATGAERLARALEAALWRVIDLAELHAPGEPCHLNFALSDGQHAVAARFSTDEVHGPESLYVHFGANPLLRAAHTDGADTPALFVSSERLSADPAWSSVPANHLVIASRGLAPTLRACRRPPRARRGAA